MHTPDTSGYADDEKLVRYLLGLLPDEEAERLDEASIADDEVASRLHAVENDLVDGYVSGTLTGDTLARFESFYLTSPRRRANVTFARSFLRAVNRAAPADSENGGNSPPVLAGDREAPPASALQADARTTRSKVVSRLMAVAAMLLVACGALLFQAVRLRNGLNEARRDRLAQELRARDLEQQLDEQRAANAAAAGALARARESAGSLASRAAQALTTALVLLPQTRAVGPIPTLAIPLDADSAVFELQLESNDFPRYRAALVDPTSNQTVWRSDPVTATAGQMPTVSVAVPVRVLKPQHYSLALSADGAGDVKVVGSYTFQVARR